MHLFREHDMSKKKRLTKKASNLLTTILLVFCIGIFGYSAYQIFRFERNERISEKNHDRVLALITPGSSDTAEDSGSTSDAFTFTHASWESLYAANSDFGGFLRFDSGIIAEPLVQGADNDYYLRRDFYGNYDDRGTVFLDYRNGWDDQNTTFYGHLVYYDSAARFSPLAGLTDQSYYDANSTFTIYRENEAVLYRIAYVYYYDIESDYDYDYTQNTFYDEQDFENFISLPQARNLVNTSADITYSDRFVTLQTCVKYRSSMRLIVVAKEVSRIPYSS